MRVMNGFLGSGSKGGFQRMGKGALACLLWAGGIETAGAQALATESFDYETTRWDASVPGNYGGGTGWGANTWQVDLTQQPGHPVPKAAIFGTSDFAPYEAQTAYAWGHGGRLYRDLGSALDSSPGTKIYFCVDMYTPETANSHVSGGLGGFGVSIESQAAKPGELILWEPNNTSTWNEPKPAELTGLYGEWHRMTAEIEFSATGSVLRAWIDASRETDPHEVLTSTSTAFTGSRFVIAHWGDSGHALADNILIGTNFGDVALPLAVLGTNGVLITSGEAVSSEKGTRFPATRYGRAFTNVFSITNSGATSLLLSQWATNGTGAASFLLVDPPATISAGTASNVAVVYRPMALGEQVATLSFSNSGAIPARTIRLAGEGYVNATFSTNRGPFAGGNTITVTHDLEVAITNVLVGGTGVEPSSADATQFTFALPAAAVAGEVFFTLQSAEYADLTLTNAYTYHPAGFIGYSDPETWVEVGGLPEARWCLAAATLGNRLYAMGGYDGVDAVHDTVYAFDGTNWTVETALPSALAEVGATSDGANIWLAGGGSDETLAFDGSTWTSMGHLTDARVWPVMAVFSNRPVVISGGVPYVTEYDGADWNERTPLPGGADLYGGAGGVVGNFLYAAGGGLNSGYSANAWRYDGSDWTAVASLPAARAYMATAVWRDRVYAMGGLDQNESIVDTVYRFDGTAWATAPALPDRIYCPAAAVLNDQLYFIGGYSDSRGGAVTNVYAYQPGAEHSGVSPSNGVLAGGWMVTIRGENLGNGSDITNVTLCGVAVTNIESQSATQVVVWAGSRGSSATGDVVVFSTSYGATTKSHAFTYAESTRVVLYDLFLRMEGGVVQVCWQTASEEESVGFDLFRWDGAAWVKVNESLVMARDPMGAIYSVADAGANATEAFLYKLVEVETDGSVREYGPFERAVWTPRLENVGVDERGVVLRWLSREGESYEVRRTRSLRMPLATMESGVAATPPVNEFVDKEKVEGGAFYQIRVEE